MLSNKCHTCLLKAFPYESGEMLNKMERETTRLPLFIVSLWIPVACLLCSIQNEDTLIGVQRTRGKAWEVTEVQGRVLDIQIS
jgi:hypothetical protein